MIVRVGMTFSLLVPPNHFLYLYKEKSQFDIVFSPFSMCGAVTRCLSLRRWSRVLRLLELTSLLSVERSERRGAGGGAAGGAGDAGGGAGARSDRRSHSCATRAICACWSSSARSHTARKARSDALEPPAPPPAPPPPAAAERGARGPLLSPAARLCTTTHVKVYKIRSTSKRSRAQKARHLWTNRKKPRVQNIRYVIGLRGHQIHKKNVVDRRQPVRAMLASCIAGVGESGIVRVSLAVRARPAAARVARRGERGRGGRGERGEVSGRGGRRRRRPVHAARVHHQVVIAAKTPTNVW